MPVATRSGAGDWRSRLLTSEGDIRRLVRSARRVAVVGIKPESKADQPAHYVPSYLQSAGVEVVPVPTYYPDVTEILGEKVHRSVSGVEGEIDIVNFFRRSEDVEAHVDDVLQKQPLPRAVWLQSGISNEAAAEAFARRGVFVVMDRCLLVEHQRHASAL